MYQQVEDMCSSKRRATGSVEPDGVFTNPSLLDEYIDAIISLPRKRLSLYISTMMDCLGYSYEMVRYRQQVFEEVDILRNRHKDLVVTSITTGGKGEGTTLLYENDVDQMIVIKDVICADNPCQFYTNDDVTLVKTERNETSPGYAKLKLVRCDGNLRNDFITACVFESESGSYYLSSQICTHEIMTRLRKKVSQKGLTSETTRGPSVPLSDRYSNYLDSVVCFRCFCPDIVERWVSRPRKHGWPSREIICEISQLDGHVVPVGMKGSDNMYREWRICYTLAELHLMRNLNPTQMKVYIILKEICKCVLHPVFQDMTSYIMKNVVLWMCEKKGSRRFRPDLLMDRLFDCLKYLRTRIYENNFPSYMIPERNLLAGRLGVQQRLQLTSLLTNLLNEEGMMVLRCDKLREGMIVMYLTPGMFREFGEKRDKVESMMLMKCIIRIETRKPGSSQEMLDRLLKQNKRLRDISIHIDQLIRFNESELRHTGKSGEEIVGLRESKLSQLLS